MYKHFQNERGNIKCRSFVYHLYFVHQSYYSSLVLGLLNMAGKSLLVAAIDFGTTFSGWGFSFKHEFEQDPTKVSAKNWTGGQHISLKAPTCALIKEDGITLHSFGNKAESKYAELAADGDHEKWYFFKRFKMNLFEKGLGKNLMLNDATGNKTLPAKKVFSLSIKYLKDDLIKTSIDRIGSSGLEEDDIFWVLSVPAIWNDAAKQFMREAAEEAGIPRLKLTIALEPEAASLYCHHLKVEQCGSDKTLAKYGVGKRYLVLDAGGGTVDITVHEVMVGGRLKELFKASGGAWGGVKVDDAFYNFLCDIAGSNVMKTFQDKHMEDYLELFRDFELKKRDIEPISDSKVTIRIPPSLNNLVKKNQSEEFADAIKRTIYSDKVIPVGDKIRVDPAVVKGFFKPSLESIVKHVEELLQSDTNRGVEAIVMVGGFSESPMLQETIRNNFQRLTIIIPAEAGLAVLKGAVIYGHSPTTIAQRVSKYTYGTDVSLQFDPDKHPYARRKINFDGSVRCEDVFSKLAEAGQTLVVGEAQDEQTYVTITENQTSMGMNIYATHEKNPEYVDDVGCYKIGTFDVLVSGSGVGRAVTVKMIFGGTEIDVECKEVATGKITHLKVDFLS